MSAKISADVVNNLSYRCLIWQANESSLLSAAKIDPLLAVAVKDLEQSEKINTRKQKISCMLSGGGMKQRIVQTCLVSLT